MKNGIAVDLEKDAGKISKLTLYLFLPGKLPFTSAASLSLANYFHQSLILQGKLKKDEASRIASFFLANRAEWGHWEKFFEEAWEFLAAYYK
jgi:hypothetical protein